MAVSVTDGSWAIGLGMLSRSRGRCWGRLLREQTTSGEGPSPLRLFSREFWPALNRTHNVRGVVDEVTAHHELVLSLISARHATRRART